jgi:hypothetical protein
MGVAMKWRGQRQSGNVEDVRRSGVRRGAAPVGGLGVVVLLLLGLFFGVDVTPLLQGGGGQVVTTDEVEITAEDEERAAFVATVLAFTEDVWGPVFDRQVGRPYEPPVLRLFKGGTDSPCGGADGATGPFYCPIDRKAYLDTDFFVTLERQLGAGGDFAAAYVVAHEVAHHVQNQLGTLGAVNQRRRQVGEAESNALSVRIELQADCYSGIWARGVEERFGVLDETDIREAVNAARRIGDDVLQKAAGRRPMPHTFTHGTAEQRSRWFMTGYRSGDLDACDTFAVAQP